MKGTLMQTRATLLRHSWLASLLGRRPGAGSQGLKRLEFLVVIL